MQGFSFAVIGGSKDERGYINGSNVFEVYGESWDYIISLLCRCGSLVSVISGPSHLAFHLGIKNYLLDNQSLHMRWGVNPHAFKITDPIPTLTAERIMEFL